jgi:hypothetical protein
MYGITIHSEIDRSVATISSDLKEFGTPENSEFNAAMDGIE